MITLDQLEYYWSTYKDLSRAGDLKEWRKKYPHLYKAWDAYEQAVRRVTTELAYLENEEYSE